MKKFIPVLIFLFIFVNPLFSGYKFEKISDDTLNIGLRSVFFIDENTGWAVGHNGKIIKTTDGGYSWEKQASGTDSSLYDIYFIDENKGWAVGGSKNNCDHPEECKRIIINTTNGGKTWNLQYSDDDNSLGNIYFINDSIGFATGSYIAYKKLLRTTNGGSSWEPYYFDNCFIIRDIQFINDSVGYTAGEIAADFWDRGTVILKTTNCGDTWESEIYHDEYDDYLMSICSISILDENIAWAAGGCTWGPVGSILYRDSSAKWYFNYVALPPDSYNLSSWFNEIIFFDKEHGLAFSSMSIIFETTNGGMTWDTLLNQPDIHEPLIFINELDNCWAIDIQWDLDDGETGILYKLIHTPDEVAETPETFTIFPNPANDYINIDIEAEINYQVNITDIFGREFYQGQGKKISTENMPSGVYCCRIRNGNQVLNKNIIINK